PVFYAIRRSAVPVMVSLCTIVFSIVINVVLVRAMGFRGLALGTSLAVLVNGGALLLLLPRHLGGIERRAVALTFVQTAAASCVMAAVSCGAERLLVRGLAGGGTVTQVIRLFGAIAAGLGALTAAAKLLRIREFDDAVAGAVGRLL